MASNKVDVYVHNCECGAIVKCPYHRAGQVFSTVTMSLPEFWRTEYDAGHIAVDRETFERLLADFEMFAQGPDT